MNLWHRVYAKLAVMMGLQVHGPADANQAIDWLEQVQAAGQNMLIQITMMRLMLTAKAFDDGMLVNCLGPLSERYRQPRETDFEDAKALMSLGQGVIDWDVPVAKAAPKPEKRLISLH